MIRKMLNEVAENWTGAADREVSTKMNAAYATLSHMADLTDL